jgi:hypothetical protein
MTKTTLAILKWLKGPIAIVSGLIGTWLYTNIPGLHVFGNTAAQTGKWVDGVIVFGITAGATYLAHDSRDQRTDRRCGESDRPGRDHYHYSQDRACRRKVR